MISTEAIKAHNPIEDVVERYYELTGRGTKLTAKGNPSLTIDTAKQLWHDFGTSRGVSGRTGGTVIDFIMEYEGLDFQGACNFLSKGITDATPVPTPRNTQNPADEKKKRKFAEQIKRENRAALTPALALEGLRELYPFINDATPFLHLLGYSGYHDTLTFEMPDLSINRRTQKGKWVATSGNKRNYIPYRIDDSSPYVYLYSGMAEIIACEAMGINYIGLQMDSSDKFINKEITAAMKDKTLIVIEENDESSQRLSQRLRCLFMDVKILKIGANKSYGYDLRDFVNDTGSFEVAKMMLQQLADMMPLEKRLIQDEIIIPYNGHFIASNTEVDVGSLDSCVIKARTGSGKTYSFNNRPGVLILVPRVEQSTVGRGDRSDFVIDKILDSGAVMTYEKFMGHYKANKEFRLYVDTKRFKVVVDEAHMITASTKYEIIYNLDAVFMSGTIHGAFRSDLQHYKFKPKQPVKLYYTDKEIPKFDDALYFVDRAKRLMTNYPFNCVVGVEHEFSNFNVHNHKAGQIFATCALREGISITTGSFSACIVVSQTCDTWSTKDIIQGMNRVRGEDVLRIVTKPIEKPKDTFAEHKYYADLANSLTDTKEINTIMGEEYSRLIKMTHKVNGYIKSSDYGVACYLAYKTRNDYDEDFYTFEAYEPEEAMEIKNSKAKDIEEDEIYLEHKIGNDLYEYPLSKRDQFMRWARHKESGLVDKIMRMHDKKSLHDLYTRSKLSKDIKKAYNKSFNRGKTPRKYSIDMFYELLRTVVNIELTDTKREGRSVERISKFTDYKYLILEVISECPIEGVKYVGNVEFKTYSFPIEETTLNYTANPVHSVKTAKKIGRPEIAPEITIENSEKTSHFAPEKEPFSTVEKTPPKPPEKSRIERANEEFLNEISEL